MTGSLRHGMDDEMALRSVGVVLLLDPKALDLVNRKIPSPKS